MTARKGELLSNWADLPLLHRKEKENRVNEGFCIIGSVSATMYF